MCFFVGVFSNAASPGFALIPGGTFQMGDSFNEGCRSERPVHGVNVGAFFLQAKETTKAEWDKVRTWALANGYSFGQYRSRQGSAVSRSHGELV